MIPENQEVRGQISEESDHDSRKPGGRGQISDELDHISGKPGGGRSD